MEHTREPWHAHGGSIYRDAYPNVDAPIAHMDRSDRARDAEIYPVERDENAKRIVACVNACAGMEDPSAEIARLRRVEAAARALLNCHTGAPWQTEDIRNRAFRNLSSALEDA